MFILTQVTTWPFWLWEENSSEPSVREKVIKVNASQLKNKSWGTELDNVLQNPYLTLKGGAYENMHSRKKSYEKQQMTEWRK